MSEHHDCRDHHPQDIFDDRNACDEYREMTRRQFLDRSRSAAKITLAGATGLVSLGTLPKVVLGSGKMRGGTKRKVLVYVFMRGGPDMLTRIVPWTDQWYYAPNYNNGSDPVFVNGLRPTIGLNPPTAQPYEYPSITDRALDAGDVNGDGFGINEAYDDPNWFNFDDRDGLYEIFNSQDNDIAFLVAAGSPDSNRSHFQAEQRVEYGSPNQPQTVFTGFLSRYLAVAPTLGSTLRAAALPDNSLVPKVLSFAENTMVFKQIEDVTYPGHPATEAALVQRYAEETADPLKAGVLNTFEVIDLLEGVDTTPSPNAKYNGSAFGERMRNAAALIKAGIDIECIYTDRTGWDNHANQQTHKGEAPNDNQGMYNRLKDMSQNLAAFRRDLVDAGVWDDVVVVEQGEFSRQNNENINQGTDHGNGGIITVMGGSVNGGLYCKKFDGTDGWPGLEPTMLQQIGQHDAMKTTIDYRWIFTEIFNRAMGVDLNTINNAIFPFTAEQPPYVYQDLGLLT